MMLLLVSRARRLRLPLQDTIYLAFKLAFHEWLFDRHTILLRSAILSQQSSSSLLILYEFSLDVFNLFVRVVKHASDLRLRTGHLSHLVLLKGFLID